MESKIETRLTFETTTFRHDGEFKTHPCELYEWWGNDTCQVTDFNSELQGIEVSEGEYKVTLILERIGDI